MIRDGKIRLLALERMLTDKPQTARRLIERLEDEYNITAKRKAIYSDMAALTNFFNVQVKHSGKDRVSGFYIPKEGKE